MTVDMSNLDPSELFLSKLYYVDGTGFHERLLKLYFVKKS